MVPVGGGEVGGGEAEPGQPAHQFGGRPGAAAGPAAAQDDRRAREQGAEDLLQGGVGAQHGQLQDAFAGREPVRVDDPVEGEHQRTVGDRDPLGPAGRPGGVDQVREIVRARAVVGPKPTPARAGIGRGRRRPGAVRPHHRHPRKLVTVGDHHPRPAVLDQPGQPPLRVRRVERQEGSSRLEHAQPGGDQVRPAFQADRYHLLRPRAARLQLGGQPVAEQVEFAVTQGGVLGDDGERPGVVHRPRAEQPVHGVRESGRRCFATTAAPRSRPRTAVSRKARTAVSREARKAPGTGESQPRGPPFPLHPGPALVPSGRPVDRVPPGGDGQVPGPERVLTVLVAYHGVTPGPRIRWYALCAVCCVVHRLDLVLWRQNAWECDISDYTHSRHIENVRSHPDRTPHTRARTRPTPGTETRRVLARTRAQSPAGERPEAPGEPEFRHTRRPRPPEGPGAPRRRPRPNSPARPAG